MEKFSKIKPRDEFKEKDDKILYENDYVKLIEFEDWAIMKEKDFVVCIAYLIETNQFILRHEYVPSYKYVDNNDYYLTILSGGIEQGESPDDAIKRELEEEAGIVINDNYNLEKPNVFFISKSSCNKYYTYIIELNENDYHEVIPKGDGSDIEKKSKSVKIDAKYINSLKPSDIITSYMLLKLKEYLSI